MRTEVQEPIEELTVAIQTLTSEIRTVFSIAERSIPVKMVFLMFFILVLALAGVEGVQWLFKVYLAHG